jgi:rod shape-determining protein MreC
MPPFLKSQKKALIFAGLVFVQVVALSLQIPGGSGPSLFERTVFVVLSPVQKAVHGIFSGVATVWNRYIDLRRVESLNESLQDEVFRLRQENLALRGGLESLRDARDVETVLSSLNEPFLVASVIGVDASNPYRSVVIDRGSSSGVRPDMAVVDRSGALAGRAIQPIGPGTATVQLITDDASAVAVQSETSRVQGVLVGNSLSGKCSLRYVLATNASLAENEELLTTGFDEMYPAGLKAGTVLSVVADGSLFKRITVRPHIDWRRMSKVAVLTRVVNESGQGRRK